MATENTTALGLVNENAEARANQSGDGEEALAGLLYEGCMDLFKELYEESSRSSSPLSRSERCHLKEGLGRLFLWGDSFSGKMLDRILGQSLDLRYTVLGFLAGIGKVLTGKLHTMVCRPQQGGKSLRHASNLNVLIEKAESMIAEAGRIRDNDSDQDSDSEASDSSRSDILEDISTYTVCLMELVPSMERTLSYVLSKSQTKQQVPPEAFEVSESARPYVQNVIDKFPRADKKLIERLGEANWSMHRSVRLRIDDVSKHTTAGPDVDSANFRRYYVLHNAGRGTSPPLKSTYAASAVSDASIKSSEANRRGKSRTFPSTPHEAAAADLFQCKICGKTLNITQGIAWRRHVLLDLRPYICTFPTCKDGLVRFPTRELWAEHEFSEHRIEKVWHCTECADIFAEIELWRKHIGSRHGILFNALQFNIAAALAEKNMPGLLAHSQCPLCLNFVGTTRKAFARHVGKHMEEIALSALPPEMDSDTESEAELSEHDTYSACTDDGPEVISFQSDVASDPGTVNAVVSDQQGGDGLGIDKLTRGDPQQLSKSKSRSSSIPRTGVVTPPPRSEYQKDPQEPDRGESPQNLYFERDPRQPCRRCRRRKILCFGFKYSKDGRCTFCHCAQQKCIFTPVSSGEQASVPAYTPDQGLPNTESSTKEYPFNLGVPGVHITCSVSVLQTLYPSSTYMKLPDTAVIQSAAEMFRCIEHRSRFSNVQTLIIRLQIKLQSDIVTRTFLVDRNDTQEYEDFVRTSKLFLENQLRHGKDKNCTVHFIIEPVVARKMSTGFVGKEKEDQKTFENLPSPQHHLAWDLETPQTVGELVTPQYYEEESFSPPMVYNSKWEPIPLDPNIHEEYESRRTSPQPDQSRNTIFARPSATYSTQPMAESPKVELGFGIPEEE